MKKKLIIFVIAVSIIVIFAMIIIYIVSQQSSKEVIANNIDNNVSSDDIFTDIDNDLAYSLNKTLKYQYELDDDFVFSSASKRKNNNDIVMYYAYKEDFNVNITLADNGSIKSFGISTFKLYQDKEKILDLLLCLLDKNILILTQEEKYFIISYAFDNSMPVYNTKDLYVYVHTDNFYMLSVTKKA